MTPTTERLAPAAACLLLALAGCMPDRDHGHDHDNGHGEEPLLEARTDWSGPFELFAEFPPLIAGAPAPFAAHLTRLEDFSPVESGRLDVVLEAAGRPVARFRVDAPVRPGIFRPTVQPRDPGRFELVVEVSSGPLQSRHELGPVTVFTDPGAVDVEPVGADGEITFLKEQQWAERFATERVQVRPLRPSVPGFAVVRAPADGGAEVLAPADGYLGLTGLAAAGDRVEAGAVLAWLVPRLGDRSDLGELQVALERARSRLELAEREAARLGGLFDEGAIPERRLTEALAERDLARAELRAARARVEQYSLADTEAGIALRSPVAGEVVTAAAAPGAFVAAGERLFQVAVPDRRWLEVRVPERLAADLARAGGAWLEGEGGQSVVLDAASGARVVRIEGAVDPATRTAMVTIEYPTGRGPGLIGARFPARVFTASPEPRLSIPRRALVDEGSRRVVFVQTGGERFESRVVETGIVDGPYVEVFRGLAEGERIVTEGAWSVRLAGVGGDEVGHGHAH